MKQQYSLNVHSSISKQQKQSLHYAPMLAHAKYYAKNQSIYLVKYATSKLVYAAKFCMSGQTNYYVH